MNVLLGQQRGGQERERGPGECCTELLHMPSNSSGYTWRLYACFRSGGKEGEKREEVGRGKQQVIESQRRLFRVQHRTDADVTSVRVAGDSKEQQHRVQEEKTRQVRKCARQGGRQRAAVGIACIVCACNIAAWVRACLCMEGACPCIVHPPCMCKLANLHPCMLQALHPCMRPCLHARGRRREARNTATTCLHE